MRYSILQVSLILAACLSLEAQAQTIFIEDATLHTMATPPVIEDADILLRDGVIVEAGRGLTAPPDATLIEAFGRPVTPAFFAGISAIGLLEISQEETTADQSLELLKMHPEFDATLAFNPYSTLIPITRIEGYGWTMLAPGFKGSFVGGQGRAASLNGSFDAFLSQPALFIGMGAKTSKLSGQSRAAQFMLLNQAMEESQSEVSWSPDSLLTKQGRKTLASFKDSGVVIFDTDRASDIRQVIAFASKHGLNAVISGGAEAWIVAEDLAEAGVPVVLDPLRNLPGNFDQLGARLDNAAILHDAGVTISFTSGKDASHNARKLRQAAGVAVANGLPYEAALAGMTVNPAGIFALEEGFGTVAAGVGANLVIWSGDPLEVTSIAETVILDGKNVPMVSRQTLLRDRYLPQNPGKPRAYIKP
jgi:hypothetical protein